MGFQADWERRQESPVGQVQRGLRQSGRSGETAGNERLTAATAGVLLVLLAVEGATIVALRPLLSVHVFVGVLLIPPIVLKLASTGYRFVRYYTRHPAYRRQGPPRLLLRLLGPLVVVSTLALFGTGVARVVQGPRAGVGGVPDAKESSVSGGILLTGVAEGGLQVLLTTDEAWEDEEQVAPAERPTVSAAAAAVS